MNETNLSRHLRILASRLEARLFRNQVGHYTIEGGRKITTGLGVGSPDLVGWKTLEITPEMVGKSVAVFAGIEVKSGHRKASPKQESWIAAIRAAGGIACVARNADEVQAVLSDAGARQFLGTYAAANPNPDRRLVEDRRRAKVLAQKSGIE